jgi:hypothetical protein
MDIPLNWGIERRLGHHFTGPLTMAPMLISRIRLRSNLSTTIIFSKLQSGRTVKEARIDLPIVYPVKSGIGCVMSTVSPKMGSWMGTIIGHGKDGNLGD